MQLITKLEECAEELFKSKHIPEGDIILGVIGLLRREEREEKIRENEDGILKDLEKYYSKKLKRKSGRVAEGSSFEN